MTTIADTSDAIAMTLLKLYDAAYYKGFQEGCEYQMELQRDHVERLHEGDRET